jgi:hypothetical protein
MTTTAPVRCNRCHRVLVDPQWVAVRLGRVCAERLGLQRKRRVRAKRPRQQGTEHQPVLEGLDEINDSNEESEEL